MKAFEYNIPTKVAFGRNQIEKLPGYVEEYGKKVLLVYGGGSIKRIGIYDKVVELFEKNGITFLELSGVEPNPQIATVRKGVQLCKENAIQVIVPIGGGSTIDAAKAIAVGAFYEGDVWDIVKDNSLITEALPIVTVLTVAATGSEMDSSAVISNEETKDKAEINDDILYPRASILDPGYTFSVPAYHTAAGVSDIMSHVFEYYFTGEEVLDIETGMMESVLRTCIQYGPIAVAEPDNEQARANLMWAASWAINGFIACGNESSWPAHAMEYQLTTRYGLTHGHGMAIIENAWMQHRCNENTLSLFVRYGVNVFGIDESLPDKTIARMAIEKTRKVYEKMGLSMTLRSIGAKDESDIPQMAKNAVEEFGLDEGNMALSVEDVESIYRSCF